MEATGYAMLIDRESREVGPDFGDGEGVDRIGVATDIRRRRSSEGGEGE
jgi:hypothetical protein